MSDFAQIRYLTARGWRMTDNVHFFLEGRTDRPVDLPLAAFIQRQIDRHQAHLGSGDTMTPLSTAQTSLKAGLHGAAGQMLPA